LLMIKILKIIQFAAALILLIFFSAGHLAARSAQSKAPSPEVVKQIIHDKGNIVTTVDNWGYIGG